MQLPFDVRAQAIAAHKRLEEVGQRTGVRVNLLEAVEYYIAHSMPVGGAKTCQETLQELLDFKVFKKRSPEYVKALRWSVGKFCRVFGDRLLHEVGVEDCRRWLAENTRTPETCRAYIRDVGILFSFAVKRKYCARNPMREVDKPEAEEKDIICLSIPQVKGLLQAAKNHSEFGLLPHLTLGLFCGLRECELEKLDWQSVSLANKLVTVPKHIAKGRRIRHVDISPNLDAWLRTVRRRRGKIAPDGLKGKLEAFRAVAGYGGGKWGEELHNSVRHSFATYHVAAYQNAALTALQMGHRSQDLLFDHYRALATLAQGKSYWDIYPPEKKKSVSTKRSNPSATSSAGSGATHRQDVGS